MWMDSNSRSASSISAFACSLDDGKMKRSSMYENMPGNHSV